MTSTQQSSQVKIQEHVHVQEQVQDQDQNEKHSIYNGKYKKSPKDGKHFLDILDLLVDTFDGMPSDEILKLFWGDTRKSLEDIIKNSNKREKKAENKFDPKINKPTNANILFQKDYIQQCINKNIKFKLIDSVIEYTKYKEMCASNNEPNKYIIESQNLKDAYTVNFNTLYNTAITSGSIPTPKPKRPLSAYFIYMADVRESLKLKYIDETDRKSVNAKICIDSGIMWKQLSDADKTKYLTIANEAKQKYKNTLTLWEYNELQRNKKNNSDSKSTDINIETTGSSQIKPKPKPKSNTTVASNTSNKSNKSKTPISNINDVDLEDIEEDEDEDEHENVVLEDIEEDENENENDDEDDDEDAEIDNTIDKCNTKNSYKTPLTLDVFQVSNSSSTINENLNDDSEDAEDADADADADADDDANDAVATKATKTTKTTKATKTTKTVKSPKTDKSPKTPKTPKTDKTPNTPKTPKTDKTDKTDKTHKTSKVSKST
jgi:hypothetical protein